jgi:tetratricopeptide (TPR) repeat protein
MSWSNGIQTRRGTAGFVSLRPIVASPAGVAATDDLARQRLDARGAYQQGATGEALERQRRVLSRAAGAGEATVDDFLFLGLLLVGGRRHEEALACLREGLARFPDEPALHENMGVVMLGIGATADGIMAAEHALSLGSDSPNVLDLLADAHGRSGRMDRAVEYGRRALEAKDHKFGAATPLARVPDQRPPPFNPMAPAENVIAYTLWGNNPRYHVPLLENVRILQHLFPGWTMRVYHDDSVDPAYLTLLRERGVDTRRMTLATGEAERRRLLWRFDVAADPSVRRFLCRDADSILTVKERVAVDAWLASDRPFHVMRDYYSHTDLILAGMWGGVGGILPPVATLLRAYRGWRIEHDHVDQDLLAETVWPIIRQHTLIHDSVFAPCLGAMPFPPFGHLPPNMHVGQNAFLLFQPPG